MINNYPKGGLKMTDIESFSKSLKATWIKKYLDQGNQGKWKAFLELELQPYGIDTKTLTNIFKNPIFFLIRDPGNLVRFKL